MREACPKVILRRVPCGRRRKFARRAIASLSRKIVGAMLSAWMAVALFALLFAACSVPAPDLFKPDIVVAADGTGDFKTIQAAVQSIPATNRDRVVVFIKDGTYHEKIRVDASFITLRGQSRKGTRIEFPQLKDDFVAHPDALGWAVINLNGANDFVSENLTVENTASDMLAHTFTIYGTGDRTVIVNCDVLSHGGDTLSLWLGDRGRYYHARCNFSGSADFVCPRGWCYATDCNFYEHRKGAAVWHDGRFDPDMKFVLRNCHFDGAKGFNLGRHQVDAQFYFLTCKFSSKMGDKPIRRVIYPPKGGPATEADIQRNAELDKQNHWGERTYFYNCHRDGGDFDWFANNLSSASGSPKPKEITAAWTFGGKWNPEKESGPTIQQLRAIRGQIAVLFSEPVTVKGKPRLRMRSNGVRKYLSGSGTDTLFFGRPSDSDDAVRTVDLNGGAIIACAASATLRPADLSLRAVQTFTAKSYEPFRAATNDASQDDFFAFRRSSAVPNDATVEVFDQSTRWSATFWK
jgi:pectinesterase